MDRSDRLALVPDDLVDVSRDEARESPLPDGEWYVADGPGAQLVYDLSDLTVPRPAYLTFDALADASSITAFEVRVIESAEGSFDGLDSSLAQLAMDRILGEETTYSLKYRCYGGCSARIPVHLPDVPTETEPVRPWGGRLMVSESGGAADLASVDRVVVELVRAQETPVRWCQTPLRVAREAPERRPDPVLATDPPLVDELGQSTGREWPGKSESAEEVTDRLERQRAAAGEARWPDAFDRWGGWTGRSFEATGYFRVESTDDRWWLVDPDGHPFWSSGLNAVTPACPARIRGLGDALAWLPAPDGPYAPARGDHDGAPTVDYLVANLVRAFGEEWRDAWGEVATDALRRWGFNSAGCWSDREPVREAGIPYFRTLSFADLETPLVGDYFPDVFHPEFDDHARAYAEPLAETAGDPHLVGYFLGQYHPWTHARTPPAERMLYETETCHSRSAFAGFLRDRYDGDEDLSAAWGDEVTFEAVEEGEWDRAVPEGAGDDLATFSRRMVRRLFDRLGAACAAVDPNHLNFGIRFSGVPPDHVLAGLSAVDVFTAYCYSADPSPGYAEVSEEHDLPVLVGEWQVGATDAGPPSAGFCGVETQADRGDAFAEFVEGVAAEPWSVGVHYFRLYDLAPFGNVRGECSNVGLLDVCNRPYGEFGDAVRRTNERLYDVVAGDRPPADPGVEYMEDV